MKRILFFAFFLLLIMAISAQEETTRQEVNLNNIRTLESEQEFTEEIIIKKPDNASLMTRKETDATVDMRIDIKEKIKKSNKMLY